MSDGNKVRVGWRLGNDLTWVFFLLLAVLTLIASFLVRASVAAWLIPLTWLGSLLLILVSYSWWCQISKIAVGFVEERTPLIVSISGTTTGAVLVGFSIAATLSDNPMVFSFFTPAAPDGFFWVPVTLIATIAMGVYALFGTVVFWLLPFRYVRRAVSSFVALATFFQPILLGLSTHQILKLAALGSF